MKSQVMLSGADIITQMSFLYVDLAPLIPLLHPRVIMQMFVVVKVVFQLVPEHLNADWFSSPAILLPKRTDSLCPTSSIE